MPSFTGPLRLAIFLLVVLVTVRAAENYVPFHPTLRGGDAYLLPAGQLHPTQFSVGRREVAHKRRLIDAMDTAGLQRYLQDKDVPIVIGPGGVPYMTDGHHTISALLASAQASKTVYGHILANWSDLDETAFWTRMQAARYTYLFDEHGRGPQAPGDLPATLAAMRHDIYRGLAWAVMKAGGFAERKGVFFQEFFWADYFRQRVRWNDESDADFQRAVAEAVILAREAAAAQLPGYLAPQP